MEQKNIETILTALAENIREHELEASLKDYEIDRLRAENKRLSGENDVLRAKITSLAEQIACLECGVIQEADDGEL